MVKDMEDYLPLDFDYISTFACFLGEDYEAMHGGFDITPFARLGSDEENTIK